MTRRQRTGARWSWTGEYRRNREKTPKPEPQDGTTHVAPLPDDLPVGEAEEGDGPRGWQDVLLARLHQLNPDAFEEFVLYLLRLYGLQLTRVGGSGDEGVDCIGTAPISPVLSSRVAVQVKRYDPQGRPIGREVVGLFQRDAQTKGAERAILVTLGKFSEPARRAATVATPTVDLIDGITSRSAAPRLLSPGSWIVRGCSERRCAGLPARTAEPDDFAAFMDCNGGRRNASRRVERLVPALASRSAARIVTDS